MSEEDLQERFEEWLFNMDDALDELRVNVDSQSDWLDFTPESLRRIEAWLLEAKLASQDANIVLDRASRYLGETFRKTVGGKWSLELDGSMLFYGLPIVTGYSSTGIVFCPSEIVRNFFYKGHPGSLEGALASHARFADLVS